MACGVIIDASRIAAFTESGTYDLYVYPTGKETISVCGENHGQYVDTAELAGQAVRPLVTVEGKFEGTMPPLEMSRDTVKPVLAMDGEIDDSLIDDSNVTITLGEGDGYYDYLFQYDLGALSGEWESGTTDYSLISFDGTFSEQGGSLILVTGPAFTSADEIPVICDAYPDVFTAQWPVAFDACGVTAQDVRAEGRVLP